MRISERLAMSYVNCEETLPRSFLSMYCFTMRPPYNLQSSSSATLDELKKKNRSHWLVYTIT
jgi:hypothetical protein